MNWLVRLFKGRSLSLLHRRQLKTIIDANRLTIMRSLSRCETLSRPSLEGKTSNYLRREREREREIEHTEGGRRRIWGWRMNLVKGSDLHWRAASVSKISQNSEFWLFLFCLNWCVCVSTKRSEKITSFGGGCALVCSGSPAQSECDRSQHGDRSSSKIAECAWKQDRIGWIAFRNRLKSL